MNNNRFHNQIFNAEEMTFINSAAKNEKLSEFSRDGFIGILDFNLSICDDDMVYGLIAGLKEKTARLTDGEWDEMKLGLPFSVPYCEGDDEPAVGEE